MQGLFDLPGMGVIRRRAYVMLLAAGMAGLLTWLLSDSPLTVTPASVPALAAARSGSPMKALTSGTHMDGFSAWSPDGAQIAFMRDGRIWMINASGQGARPLTRPDGAWDAAPAWRPDGKQLAFIRLFPESKEPKAQVLAIDPATGKETKLLEEQEPVGYLAWAPSGEQLYYTTAQRINRVEPATGKQEQVFKVSGDWELIAGGIAISRDGAVAVVGAGPRMEQGVAYDLWRLPLNGKSDPERLTNGGGIMPAFDPAGKRLAYRNPREASGVYLLTLAAHSGKRILADAEKLMYFHPAFSPDGKHLAVSQLSLNGGAGGEGRRFISHLYLVSVGDGP